MKRYYYDLHVHSCLSPCGDEDNTPNNIAGMAKLCGIDILALTDHNSTKNCPAFFEAAEKYGIIPVAGMELTTAEDIHVVCLFEKLSDALRFDEHIDSCRTKFQNKPEIFGSQQILDGEDRLIGEVDDLLISASSVSIDQVSGLVKRYGGVCYPAHIDRDSNSIIAVLGTLPPDISFENTIIYCFINSQKSDFITLFFILSKYHLSTCKITFSFSKIELFVFFPSNI